MTEDGVLLHGATLLDAALASRPAKSRGRRAPDSAVWVRGDRIVAVGPLAEVRARAGRGVKRLDLGGGTLTPGFTDAHIHLVTWIRALGEPWLRAQDARSVEIAAGERAKAAPGEDWLLLRGWVPREWPAAERHRSLLDRIAPERPLVLHAVDGHSVWGNRAAFERAGIDDRASDPQGGSVERDRSGAPTGVLIEEAQKLMSEKIRRGTPARDDLAAAITKARSLGITSAHDFDRGSTWRAAAELERAGRLRFRLLLSVPVSSLEAGETLGLAAGLGGERLRVGPVKMFADGTLGSATALLEEPYEGSRGRGIEVMSPAQLAVACTRAADAGLSVAIHAIGDRAVRNALDAIESVLRTGKRFPLPPRVEHVQLSRAEDWERFRRLGTLASVQPIHQLTDRAVARRHWGGRTARSYAWKSLVRAGARLLFGSDAPFDRAGPLLALQAALLRHEGEEPPEESFHPEQRLRLARALRAHLEEGHRAAGWPLPLGRLAPGYGADLVHFDHDLRETAVDRWHRVRVVRTWVGGFQEFGPLRGR
jgi:predicted amidohydrolase YtcJ